MNKFKKMDDVFFNSLTHRNKINASKEAHDKSLLAFQQGLINGRSLPKHSQKIVKFRKQITGIFASVAVLGISGLLLFSTGLFDFERPGEEANIGNGREDSGIVQENEIEEKLADYHEEVADIFGKVLIRTPFTFNDLNAMPTQMIFNEQLEVHLPEGWTVSEMEGDNEHLIQVAGQNGEEMNLMLFYGEYSQEEFDTHIQELTAGFDKVPSETRVNVDAFLDDIRSNRSPEISFPHPNIMPFETEDAKITMFFDIENGQYMERYISELYGYPMIFTSKLPIDEESWNLPLIFFSHMYVGYSPFTIHGSEGEMHPVYERPVKKSVILRMGAIGMEQVDVELYENDELGLTSYLPSNTDIQRIEHDYFTEWRFTEPNVSENSFYSFGKLKDGFPIEKGKEIMLDALNIDPSYYQEPDGDIPHHYSYSGGEGAPIDGYIQLIEMSGEWYYKHKHANRSDYSGGVYFPRLELFVDSIEWY